jgi:hypothetical protein
VRSFAFDGASPIAVPVFLGWELLGIAVILVGTRLMMWWGG